MTEFPLLHLHWPTTTINISKISTDIKNWPFHLSTSSTPDPVSFLYQPDNPHEGRKEIGEKNRKS
jgi:hypothetical protein